MLLEIDDDHDDDDDERWQRARSPARGEGGRRDNFSVVRGIEIPRIALSLLDKNHERRPPLPPLPLKIVACLKNGSFIDDNFTHVVWHGEMQPATSRGYW